MNTEPPNIYLYNDFRLYLEDYRISRKKKEPSFTHEYICAELGLPHTRGFFNNIVKGRRILTDANEERFIRLLRLSKDEEIYFRMLVKYNQTENASEKDIYLGRLISLNKSPTQQIDRKAFIYYRHWYNSVIRALISITDFDEDYSALAAKVHPSITAKTAKESVKLQLELGILARNERGIIKPTNTIISAGPLMRDKIIQQYQLQCLDLAKLAVNKLDRRGYNMFTNVFSISDAGYERLKVKMQEFKSEIRSLIQKDENPSTRVFHMNIFLFPGSV